MREGAREEDNKVWHDSGMYTTAGTARCGARRHRQRAIRFSLDDSLLSPTPLRPSRAVWPAAVRGPSHACVLVYAGFRRSRSEIFRKVGILTGVKQGVNYADWLST